MSCALRVTESFCRSPPFGLILNHVLFSFEQAVICIFTPSNICAMSNLVKAIDLRCRPIMQIHCLS